MIDLILAHVIPASYSLLPSKMNSPEASAMLLAIGLQESRFLNRRQAGGGPARGFWQFEGGAMSALAGVLTHKQTKAYCDQVLARMSYPRPAITRDNLLELRDALEHNDILAASLARLLLWTLPTALPKQGEPRVAWGQYLDAWRPGHAHPETWEMLYSEAWDRVNLNSPKEIYGNSGASRHRVIEGHPSRPGDSRGHAARRAPEAAARSRWHRTH